MNNEWHKVMEEMQRAGYAVCVITPDQLKGLNPREVEDRMHEEANMCIEEWNDDN